MFLDNLREFCDFALAVLDGKYGWGSEALTVFCLVFVFNFLIKSLLKRLHKKFEKDKKHWQDSFVRALHKPLSYYIWLVVGTNVLDLINFQLFEQDFFRIETMHNIIGVGAIFAFAWFCLRWKRLLVQVMVAKCQVGELAIDQSRIDFMDKIATVTITFASLLFLLEFTGHSMHTLIAFGGVGGLAIAFASQEIVASFFGGLMIYLTHPFAIGDWISLPERNIEGTVEEIGWYMTRVRTFEKRPIYVPNSFFSKVVVQTPSRMSHRRFQEFIGVRYCDISVLKAIIEDIKTMLIQHSDVDHNQRIIVSFSSFGAYSLNIRVDFYTYVIAIEEFCLVKEDILFKVAEIIAKHGAKVAFPTSTIDVVRFPHQSPIVTPSIEKKFSERVSTLDKEITPESYALD